MRELQNSKTINKYKFAAYGTTALSVFKMKILNFLLIRERESQTVARLRKLLK
jgi:hypothetical protein